jgi:hypothetical protein
MHDNFYFYATTVNIPIGFYTPRPTYMGLRILYDAMMEYSKGTFYFLICNNDDMQ